MTIFDRVRVKDVHILSDDYHLGFSLSHAERDLRRQIVRPEVAHAVNRALGQGHRSTY